jgi:hypothetical protein
MGKSSSLFAETVGHGQLKHGIMTPFQFDIGV